MNAIKGFTLIELMIVLTIIASLLSLTIPSFNSLLQKYRSYHVVSALYQHLNYARAEAVTRSKVITVCGTDDNTTCNGSKDWSDLLILIFVDDNGNGDTDDEETILKIFDLKQEGGTLFWRSFRNKSYLQWLPNGFTNYQSGNFTYCPANKDAHYAKKLIMNVAGRIYFGQDSDNDGIPEGTDKKNIEC